MSRKMGVMGVIFTISFVINVSNCYLYKAQLIVNNANTLFYKNQENLLQPEIWALNCSYFTWWKFVLRCSEKVKPKIVLSSFFLHKLRRKVMSNQFAVVSWESIDNEAINDKLTEVVSSKYLVKSDGYVLMSHQNKTYKGKLDSYHGKFRLSVHHFPLPYIISFQVIFKN